ncbi:MAG: hypothetical protein HY831_00440 [Candidatus Aenigmarchaeota archaeon]|nr:hypothetical protein [Candidatus Aenigmarchaeota archaeon]
MQYGTPRNFIHNYHTKIEKNPIRDINQALIDVYYKYYPDDKGKVVPINKWNVYSFTPYFPIADKIQKFFAEHPDEISPLSKPFDGAKNFMGELCKIAKVTIVTYQRNKRWEEVSLEWLEKNNIDFHDIVFLKDKTKFKGMFLLDDCVHNLKLIKLAGNCIPVCKDYSWNKEWDGLRIVRYDEFLSIVRNSLEDIQVN